MKDILLRAQRLTVPQEERGRPRPRATAAGQESTTALELREAFGVRRLSDSVAGAFETGSATPNPAPLDMLKKRYRRFALPPYSKRFAKFGSSTVRI